MRYNNCRKEARRMSYKKELRTAKRNLMDWRRRGKGAIGGDVMELLDEVMKIEDDAEKIIMRELEKKAKNRNKKDGR